jgi:transaldolase
MSEGGEIMSQTAQLRSFGQSLWLDNITRDLLNTGTFNPYITDLSNTGLTSNPTILDHAIKTVHLMMLQSRKSLERARAENRSSLISL